MSASAITFVWDIDSITAEERLALIWIANSSGGLGYPVCPEWIGMGRFMCCTYERACDVVSALTDKGLVRWGEEEGEQHYLWIVYGGEYFHSPEWWVDSIGGRSKRVAALIERDGPNCAYCDCLPVNYEVDHFIPRAKGGADRMHNLVLACPPCNRTKRDKDPEEFLREDRGRYETIRKSLIYLAGAPA